MAYTEPQFDAGQGRTMPSPSITDRDIVFNCPSCEGELVVDREGIGMECLCAHCGCPLVIPDRSTNASGAAPQEKPAAQRHPPALAEAPLPPSPVPVPPPRVEPTVAAVPERHFDFSALSPEQLARRLDELKHQLKENMSQDVEMRGHVNRATIELHRLHLRLKKLQERQADIEAEIIAAREWLQSASA